ncbi:MAG: ComEA family DNA-binding protein [Woeseiaceae bacterium]
MKRISQWQKPSLFAVLALCAGFANAEPVDVNSASAEEIAEALEGVGISKARAIVAHRNANGPFLSRESLTNVKGIGQRTIALNVDNILLAADEAEDAEEAD